MVQPQGRPVWKVARLGRMSSVSGQPLPPDTEVVTALFPLPEAADDAEGVRGAGLERRDFLVEEATPERLQGAFGVWHTRTAPEKPEDARRLDLDLARQLLERVLEEGNPEKAPVALTLALLLVRKRRLNLVREEGAELVVRWPREEGEVRVPAPRVDPEDAERLQQDLLRLFDL
ncbi:MAG: hypothetical protein AB7T63_12385 [Planctomycetota bacterium]